MENSEKIRAIVIGAGASGLQIADLLREKGFEVTILEAKERIGGRIKEYRNFADFPIDTGAEFIHGEDSIHFKIAEELGGKFVDMTTLHYYVEYQGKLYQDKVLAKDTQVFQRVLKLESDELVAYEKDEDLPLSEYIANYNFSEDIIHAVNCVLGAQWTTDFEILSVRGVQKWNKEWDGGRKNFLIKNMSNYELLTKKFNNVLDKVLLNSPVTNVNYVSEKGVQVTTKTGQTFTGDLVVVSLPISQLKKETIKFEPDLPVDKKEAIQKIGINVAMKIFLKFKKRFWSEDVGFLITEGIPKLCLVASGGGKSGESHILMNLMTGSVALKLSSLSDKEAAETVLEDLKRIFGPVIERDLEDYFVQRWDKEEYIEAGYSLPHIVEDKDSRKILSKPIANKIFFVGEALSDKYSTISGALDSSYSTYKEICLNFLKEK